MSYIVKVKESFMGVPKGSKGEPVEKGDQRMYKFESDSNRCDHVNLSWDYIQNNKQYFSVSKPKKKGN